MTKTTRLAAFSFLLLSTIVLRPPAACGADAPEWFVEKETWLESYLASMDRICELEARRGAAIPKFRNEKTLPAIFYPPRVTSMPDFFSRGLRKASKYSSPRMSSRSWLMPRSTE